MRIVMYDLLAIIIVLVFAVTLVYIIKDRKGKGIGTTVLWCILNICLPIIGFIIYLVASQSINNVNSN